MVIPLIHCCLHDSILVHFVHFPLHGIMVILIMSTMSFVYIVAQAFMLQLPLLRLSLNKSILYIDTFCN